MDGSSPPPIPNRPGRAIQIQSIDSLKSQTKPNEYVDTTTISGAPQRPPKLQKQDKETGVKSKPHIIKNVEQQENITNEFREHLRSCSKSVKSDSPEIPPRADRPPPVPPRDSRVCRDRLPSRLDTTRLTADPCTLKCNPEATLRTMTTPITNGKPPLPALLIISEETGYPQFPTRSYRHDKVAKDSTTTSVRPVTQQPTASNVTLTLGQTGTVTNTIICPECGQCRCSDCNGTRKLPERWLCEGNCRCSADSVVDALTCMWCVKSCFKTIIDNPDGSRVHPCACTESPKCLLRWTALAAFSLCLPCLCCYGPMRLGVCAATACYNCRKRGCDCDTD